MKIINCNSWAPHDIKWAPGVPVPLTAPPITNNNNLYYSLYVYDNGGLAIFYYRLGAVIYHFLDKDSYFYEED